MTTPPSMAGGKGDGSFQRWGDLMVHLCFVKSFPDLFHYLGWSFSVWTVDFLTHWDIRGYKSPWGTGTCQRINWKSSYLTVCGCRSARSL